MQLKPEIRFAAVGDGTRIAYAIHGDGPPLVYVRALNSHAARWWTDGATASYFRALSRSFSIVLYDARGNGLSDAASEIDLDVALHDLEAVVDDAGLGTVTLYGQGFGTPIAIAYAARHPSHVGQLFLYAAYARGRAVVITDEFIETMRTLPAAATALMARQSYPDAEHLPRRLLAPLHAAPETAARYLEFARSVDVEPELAKVEAPTLVMQPERNPQIRSLLGREVAAGIPGARFVAIEGGAYNPYAPNAFEPTLRAIGDVVGSELIGVARTRQVALLLTDIVDSTAMTQRVGERQARELHELHDTIVTDALRRCDGELVQHTGDGIMASFDSAGEAISCALAIQSELSDRNQESWEPLGVRIGVSSGEAYDHSGQPFTAAAQLVTRVTAKGRAGRVLVTDAVRELAAAQPFACTRSRSVALKGFPGRTKIHEVAPMEDRE